MDNGNWPSVADLLKGDLPTLSLTDTIHHFEAIGEDTANPSVLLLATRKRTYTVGGKEKFYWYGVYYSPKWQTENDKDGVKHISLTQSTKDHLTKYENAVPFFCMYAPKTTQKNKTYYGLTALPIEKSYLPRLKQLIPASVWEMMSDHMEFTPEED